MLLWWCFLKAFYWNISILLNFPGIASAPNLLFFWVNFEAGTLQSNAHILLSHDQPHSFFIWEQPKYSGCCGISVDQSEHQIKSMIDLSLILTNSKFSSQNGMRNMKDTMALLQALPFPFPCTPLTSYACLFSPSLSVSSACHTGYMVEQRYTWLGKDKEMTQVLVSLHKFSYKQMLINTIM